MATNYLDYELELGLAAGDTWPLAVVQSPAGQGRGVLALPIAPEQIALDAQTVSSQEAQELGQMLFGRLMADPGVSGPYMESLGVADNQGKALRVKLRIVDPALALIPWELMYEDRFGEYMALSHETPVVRYAEASQPQTPLTVTPPLHILGMAVSPKGLAPIDLAAQKRVVEAALQGLIARGMVKLEWVGGGTWRDLRQALRTGQYHIFHFVGHGTVDAASGEGALVFGGEDGAAQLLAASQLGRLLADHTPLRLAVLNACHSGTSSSSSLYTSAAATLMRRGLPAVVAMQFAIQDKAGVELARTFYETLAEGAPVERALTEARIAVSLAYPDTLGWAAPVLYLRAPDGVLFALEQTQGGARSTAAGAANGAPVPAAGGHSPAAAQTIVPYVRELKGRQLQAAIDALSTAFDRQALARMLHVAMGERLDTIAADGPLVSTVYELLEWARMRGRMTELLQAAVDTNPNSPALQDLVTLLKNNV